MKVNRRKFLKGLGCAGAGMATVPLVSSPAFARENLKLKDEHVGMLYDATKCIGCKACETACKKVNHMPPELDAQGLHEAPRDLSAKTMNIIKRYQGENGSDGSFVKRQCMHCVDPSCVSACPVNALKKEKNGVVTWDADACCGCRYCQMNCPYNIPKYEFDEAYGRIIKCELCYDTNLKEKGQPACTEICPTQAIKFGRVKDLLKEGKARIAANPDRYVNYVYGEKENGGTSVLYLSAVPFEKLGLPTLKERSNASVVEGIQHTLYKGLLAPMVIYGGLATVALRNLKKKKED